MRFKSNALLTRQSRLFALVAMAAVLLMAGCGGGDDETEPAAPSSVPTTAVPAGNADVCAGLRRIADVDQRTKGLVGQGADWETLRNLLVTEVPAALAGYDQAISTVPPEVAADIKALREITAQSAAAAEGATSALEWTQKVLELPGANEAGAAGQRLNTYAQNTCGFTVS